MICALLLCFVAFNLQSCDFKIKFYVDPIPHNTECFLGIDIGGTHSQVGIFDIQDEKPILLYSVHMKTKKIGDFNTILNDILNQAQQQYGIAVRHACIAAPGIATKEKDYSSVHGLFEIKSKELQEKTSLKTVLIVNDLFVIGHGIESIEEKNIAHIYGDISEEENKNLIKAVISIDTGIGSSLITWDAQANSCITHPGEAGLLEFSPTNELEYTLANHIKNFYAGNVSAYWANIASGSGVRRIYSMLKLMNKYNDTLQLDDHNPKIILQHSEDELCKVTIDLFFKLLGRFTRNYAFAVLPYGGLYIVGGVPEKNSSLFSESLLQYYDDPRFHQQLKKIPLFLIKDSRIGMYGAVNFLMKELKKNKNCS